MSKMGWLGIFLAAALAGCASANSGTTPDAGVTADAGPLTPDGAAPPREAREITSGGGKVSGGTFQMDIQVGHGSGQQQMSGGRFQLEGAAAVKR